MSLKHFPFPNVFVMVSVYVNLKEQPQSKVSQELMQKDIGENVRESWRKECAEETVVLEYRK